ncbi:MAG: twin-arginine translocase subunit TatC [Actinomycetota bacterium]
MRVIPRRRRPSPEATMTVVEHLEELRKRLIISFLAIAVASVVGFVLYDQILELVTGPYRQTLRTLPLESRPEGALGEGRLVYSSPVDPFLTFMKVGFFSGFLLALPVLLWQLWRFITPGLTGRERRLAIPFVLSSVVLFGGGTAFAFVIIPRGLSFLLSFGGETLLPLLTVDRYLGFLILFTLAFGVSFEFPLLMVFLSGAGVVTTEQMRRLRRFIYFGLVVFAAMITPTGDPFTLLAMWVPLIVLYEAAIVVARLLNR